MKNERLKYFSRSFANQMDILLEIIFDNIVPIKKYCCMNQ